ncbi:hypothetical protein QMO17_31140, partial [Klebsiella pneumoniae]|nr:hypothetical protein [Klebsiella pneumoniae]
MLTVYSDRHRLHHGHAELIDGEMKPCFEMPSRADFILERVRETKLGDVIAPASFGLDPVHRVHDKGFIAFLGSAWDELSALGRKHDALPLIWP